MYGSTASGSPVGCDISGNSITNNGSLIVNSTYGDRIRIDVTGTNNIVRNSESWYISLNNATLPEIPINFQNGAPTVSILPLPENIKINDQIPVTANLANDDAGPLNCSIHWSGPENGTQDAGGKPKGNPVVIGSIHVSTAGSYSLTVECTDQFELTGTGNANFEVSSTQPPTSVCGDGTCNGTETHTSCPNDCPSTPTTNHAPVMGAVTLSPDTIYPDSTVTCAGTANDSDGDNITYTYAIKVNGVKKSSTSSLHCTASVCAVGKSISCDMTAKDGKGGTDPGTSNVVTVVQKPQDIPNLDLAISVKSTKGKTIAFQSAVDYSGTYPLSYKWDFGDGKTSTTKTAVSHTYATAATYIVSLTVKDGHYAEKTDSISVVVEDASLNIEFLMPEKGQQLRIDTPLNIRIKLTDNTGITVSGAVVTAKIGTKSVSMTEQGSGEYLGKYTPKSTDADVNETSIVINASARIGSETIKGIDSETVRFFKQGAPDNGGTTPGGNDDGITTPGGGTTTEPPAGSPFDPSNPLFLGILVIVVLLVVVFIYYVAASQKNVAVATGPSKAAMVKDLMDVRKEAMLRAELDQEKKSFKEMLAKRTTYKTMLGAKGLLSGTLGKEFAKHQMNEQDFNARYMETQEKLKILQNDLKEKYAKMDDLTKQLGTARAKNIPALGEFRGEANPGNADSNPRKKVIQEQAEKNQFTKE